jgi:hypothetical protein
VPIIESSRARAATTSTRCRSQNPIRCSPSTPASGPTLLGFELKLRQDEDEDPVSFTVRFLEDGSRKPTASGAGRAADRLDRIAAFMNRPGPWNGGDICKFLAEELRESGRRLLDE